MSVLLESTEMLSKLETLLKTPVLVTFAFLNTIDLLQSITLLRIGIESNPFAVKTPFLWLMVKAAFTFGFPIGLFLLDVILARKEDSELVRFLRSFSTIGYITLIMADAFYLSVVLRNTSRLGRLF
ncbi:MAG: hypothetical protein JSV35_06825 [Candidatus Bathyarchaeota archaeon]|nr:MAG: hypothetical protein JSV35_06825 [Candidatus Bathyarchaeota archaeon]